MKQDNEGFVQALLFSAGDAVSISDLCTWTGLPEDQVARIVDNLSSESMGVIARRFGDKVQLVTNPRYGEALRAVFAPHEDGKLSTSLLETLTIIAYRQPITRLEIEEIRGVRCAYALSMLSEKGLIERTGTRAVLGHPAEYGTTDEFLRQFDLRSLSDLPPVDTLDSPPVLPV